MPEMRKQLVVNYSPVSSFHLGGVPYLGYSYSIGEENVRFRTKIN